MKKLHQIKLPQIKNCGRKKFWIIALILFFILLGIHSFRYNKCISFNKPLFAELSNIESNDSISHIQRAEIYSQISLNACTKPISLKYFEKALDEIRLAKSMSSITDKLDDTYIYSEIQIYLEHQKYNEALSLFDKFFSKPEHQADCAMLKLRAQTYNEIADYFDAIKDYLTIYEMCNATQDIHNSLAYTFIAYANTNPEIEDLQKLAKVIVNIDTLYIEKFYDNGNLTSLFSKPTQFSNLLNTILLNNDIESNDNTNIDNLESEKIFLDF